jgi:NADH:ubiquinone oxidoreductase subunit F (NADH-binding)
MIERKILSKRFDVVDPMSIMSYIEDGGYKAYQKIVKMDPISIIEEIENSKLRGRGGAGFPVHIKMMSLAKETSHTKYIICNADEGEPGNFKDRYLMEKDPHQIIEGMLIAAYATRSHHGYIYIRGEYQNSIFVMQHAINEAIEKGFLNNQSKKSYLFNIEIRQGGGSYVCGEEFALLESIEGKPGRTRVKPPFPTQKGLFGQPTLINNVETFACLPHILLMGGKNYAKIGTPSSTGTKLISLSGNVKKRGLYEIEFGTSIRNVINLLGEGTLSGRKIQMVQLGGSCGPIIPEYMLDLMIDFERFEQFESKTGSGAIIVIDDRFDMFDILHKVAEFFSHESCGKCTPCREGNIHLIHTLRKFMDYKAKIEDLNSLESQAFVMHQTSLCGLGQTSPTAIISTLHYFRSTYTDRIYESISKNLEVS